MRIILSPAKKMRVDTDTLPAQGLPVFLDRTRVVRDWIAGLSENEQRTLWKANEKIIEENHARFADMDLERNLTPAILSYDGIQYTYMAPAVFEDRELSWIQEHVRILSGFYGVVKPMDGIVPYRLEMQAKGAPDGKKDLYAYWADALYREVTAGDHTVLNLASKEYSRCIEKYLQAGDRFVTCIFGELEKGKVVQKGVYAKMARGEMIRYLAGIQAKDPEEAKNFALSGYHYDPDRSTKTEYVFVRTEVPGKMGERK